MKKILSSLIATALAVSLSACGKGDDNGSGLNYGNVTAEITGTVKDQNGNPLSGILMSDGFTQVRTGKDGKYRIPSRNRDAFYIYYSIPADAVIDDNKAGRPDFFQRLSLSKTVYDFTIRKQAVENDVRLLFIGDPQVRPSNNGLERFGSETVPDIKKFVESKGGDIPTYAFCMGDMVHNTWDQYPELFALLSKEKLGVPCFSVIGNHDHEFKDIDNPIPDIKGQHKYEAVAGPVNYSLERGGVHIVVMDDIIHQGYSEGSCSVGLTEELQAFLEEDLRTVDRGKTLLLAVHGYLAPTEENDRIWALLKEFKEARIIAGHSHSVRNHIEYTDDGRKIYGNVVGTANGVDWAATVCGDGAPMGYAVMELKGGSVKNHYYKPTCIDPAFQIRLYRTSDFPAFKRVLTGSRGITVNCSFVKYGTDIIAANIWNYDPLWTLEVYEDGVLKGAPTRNDDMYDVWACKYFYEQKNRSTTSFCQRHMHMFWYKMSSPESHVKFVARDEYGNVYEQSYITGNEEKDWPDNYINKTYL